jgi:hypothetical protein
MKPLSIVGRAQQFILQAIKATMAERVAMADELGRYVDDRERFHSAQLKMLGEKYDRDLQQSAAQFASLLGRIDELEQSINQAYADRDDFVPGDTVDPDAMVH